MQHKRRDRFVPSSLHTEIALSALNDKLKKNIAVPSPKKNRKLDGNV